MWLLYEQLGGAAFVGLGVCLALVPAQGWLGNMMAKSTKASAGFADKRVRLLTECLQGMKIVKLFAYEENFIDRITAARTQVRACLRVFLCSHPPGVSGCMCVQLCVDLLDLPC